MGKGDGKKKRKKGSSSSSLTSSSPSSSTASTSSSTSEPVRVTNGINIPVRRQIQWAKMNKEYSKQVSTGFRQRKVVRTKFRRTWDEEEIEEAAERRRRKGQDPNWDVILSRNSSSPLVIVDGYNIIHKWPRLKKHMNKGDTQRARQLLVEDLESLRSLKGWRIEVVFDGAGKSITGPLGQGPGRNLPSASDRAVSKQVTKYGVRTVFTGIGVEADTYIEARCAEAKNITKGEVTSSFIVASDDSMIRLAAHNGGALCMGADRFVSELKAVKNAVSDRVEVAVARVNGHEYRPVQLRNPGAPNRMFGRGSVVIEDKRNRKKEEIKLLDVDIKLSEEQDPMWWARLPNRTQGQ